MSMTLHRKNLKNRSIFAEVVTKSQASCFYWDRV